jgi:hypothetical protein
MKRHLGIKRHKCHYNECHKSFVAYHELKAHIISIHSEEKLYKCEINNCIKSFRFLYGLKSHMKGMHKCLK